MSSAALVTEAPDAPADQARPAANAGRRAADSKSSTSARKRQRARPRGGGLSDLAPAGERPQAPWYPLPLSEVLILFGAIGVIVGFSRGISNGGPPLIAGLAAVAIGTVEVTLREHLSGYRSHTIILAVLPVIVLDSALVLLVAPFGTAARLAMVAVDVGLFLALYRILRARFLDARRERVFTGRG